MSIETSNYRPPLPPVCVCVCVCAFSGDLFLADRAIGTVLRPSVAVCL